jgi:hypothetical protein
MTEPHWTLPKVPIQFDGERVLCFTNRSLVRLKQDHDIDAIKQFGKDGGDVLTVLPVLIWAGLLWADPKRPELAIKWDRENPNKPEDKEINPIDVRDVREWFLDNGNISHNEKWSILVLMALLGKTEEELAEMAKKQNPPEAVAVDG